MKFVSLPFYAVLVAVCTLFLIVTGAAVTNVAGSLPDTGGPGGPPGPGGPEPMPAPPGGGQLADADAGGLTALRSG